MNETSAIERLRAIMARLRDPVSGCPWDKQQTYASIVPYTLEEAYEVADAIERADYDALKGELGDLLFQVVYYCQFASEEGRFGFDEVAEAIGDKLIRRHPHVFGEEKNSSIAALHQRWEQLKAEERALRSAGPVSVLDDVPKTLPALARAYKLQKRAASVGFDWPELAPVMDKVAEEFAELRAELVAAPDQAKVAEEFGDLLFALVNLGRHLGLKPEDALRAGNAKFERRFRAIETKLAARDRKPQDAELAELDELWESVKADEKARV